MICEKMEAAFMEQINAELYSAYLYLSMKAYFAAENLNGFANWMDVQVQEETAHAMGMFDYVIQRGGKITLDNIEKPQNDWESPYAVFKAALEHEKLVTSKINALADAAQEAGDRASLLFLNWYIKEQVEEEDSFSNILSQLELTECNKNALFMLDKELASRTFTAPVIE